jgi:PST family polysaccharide transporter
VLFPALSRLRHDPARSRALYLRCVRAIALVSFPAMAGLFVVAEELLRVVFGEPWVGAAPVLQVLCGVGLMQSVGTTAGWIWRAHGRSDAQFRFGVVTSLSALAAYAVGVQWGILGVAVAYAVRNVALTWFNFALPGRCIGLRYRDVFGACAGTLACALAMAGGVAVLDATWLAGPPSAGHLAARVGAGAALYAVLALGFRLRALGELRALLRERAQSRPGASAAAAEPA